MQIFSISWIFTLITSIFMEVARKPKAQAERSLTAERRRKERERGTTVNLKFTKWYTRQTSGRYLNSGFAKLNNNARRLFRGVSAVLRALLRALFRYRIFQYYTISRNVSRLTLLWMIIFLLGRSESRDSIRCHTRPDDDRCIRGDHRTGNYTHRRAG